MFFQKKCSTGGKQTGAKIRAHLWALVLASACLKLYKNTDKSVSRLKWAKQDMNNNSCILVEEIYIFLATQATVIKLYMYWQSHTSRKRWYQHILYVAI